MFRVAFKSLLSHKLRMFLTTTAIILGVAFVSGTYIFTDSISKTFDKLFSDVYAGIDLTVRSSEEADLNSSFDEKYLATIRDTKGVRVAEPSANSLFAQFIDKDGKPIGGNGAPALGFTWVDDDELNVLYIKDGDGRAPESAGEVVMDIDTAKNNGFSVGDKVSVQSFGPLEEFNIVGLASFGEGGSLAGATLAAFDFSEAQRLFDLEGRVSDVSLVVDRGVSVAEVQTRLEKELPNQLEVVTGEQQTNEQKDQVNQGLGFINIGLLAFAGIALFVGAYIIQNTFRIIVAQRSKELSLLRAIGATRAQVIQTVVYEALFIGFIASILGIIAGFGVANGIRALGNSAGFSLPEGDLTVLPRTIIVALLVGIVVTTLSALLPAIKASRMSPVEGLRDNESNAPNKSLTKRAIFSIFLTVVGVLMLLYGLFVSDISPSPIFYVGGGVVLMFLGVSTFAPILSSPLGKIIGFPFVKTLGMPARIAELNVGRTPRRTASTASALMIGVSLVSLVTIFAASVNATVEKVIAENFPADVIAVPLNAQDPEAFIPAQFGQGLKELEDIEVVSAIKYDQGKIAGGSQFIAAVEPSTFVKVVQINPSEGFENLSSENGVLVKDDEFDSKGYEIGQEITIDFSDTKSITSKIIGTYSGEFDAPYIISRTQYRQIFPNDNADTFVAANFRDRIDQEAAQQEIDDFAKKYPTVNVQDQDELVQQSKDQINQILGLIWGLLGFAVLIAVLGITNTLALSIVERKRELGLLRAVGMTKKQIRRMVRVESIIISLFGAVLGVVMGILFAWALLKALEDEGLTAFEVPFGQVLILFALAAIAGILASIWPSYSASRVKILDAIKFE